MQPVNANNQTSNSYIDFSWSQPGVKVLLITGIALAALGALALIGVNYPNGIFSILGTTFKSLGAGLMIGSGLTTLLFTTINSMLVDRSVATPAQQLSGPQPNAPSVPPPQSQQPQQPPSITGHAPNDVSQPLPVPPPSAPSGASGRPGEHSNLSFKMPT